MKKARWKFFWLAESRKYSGMAISKAGGMVPLSDFVDVLKFKNRSDAEKYVSGSDDLVAAEHGYSL